ncbi:uncharacterized protein PGTG_10019 [Puccinia graminis f. sp. tritici CRL 75-36-700-3]|uniref:N-terminal Ras-GEF domain-containing protein n=1 Tax=Puccinia graminis f. sp. tritici (strain CRL 75-36-700-3 / race SCCL) TaxID=418459 RepID=E3KF19_PUCGT|nr:uncharacterized protein PGTG_10019 [Puccinia graminis f. sp. tritici CRL 75-36-700-3]EFP83051.2 hypothetical protein PGTG_10019 [Puccinia graminis f. sp. tritici CRL 75-36-700-3]
MDRSKSRSISPFGSNSPSKSKPFHTQTILSKSAGVPSSGAFAHLPERPTGDSATDFTPAQKLPHSSQDSGSNLSDYPQPIASSTASSPSKKFPIKSSPKNNNNSNINSLKPHHHSPAPKSRPTSSSSRFSRQNAREADVLGKILGWRQSKTLRASNSFKSSPLHQTNKHPHSSSKHLIRSTPPQELPEIFRPSNTHALSSALNTSQDSTSEKPSSGDVTQPHDFLTDTNYQTASRPYFHQQSSSDLTSSTHASSNLSSSVTHANSSQTSFNQPSPSPTQPVQLQPNPDGLPRHSQHQSSGESKLTVLRRPILKKSFSSGQLNHHFNSSHDPSKPTSQPSSFSRLSQSTELSSRDPHPCLSGLSINPPEALDPPISFASPHGIEGLSSASLSQLNKPRYISQYSHQRLSLPAMHAILDANSSLAQTIQLDQACSDDSDHSVQPIGTLLKHPTMHGVASNESIRTAKPSTEFNSLKSLSGFLPLADHQPSPGADHHDNNIPSSDHHGLRSSDLQDSTSSARPRRFQNPRVFDIFTHTHRRDPVDLMRRLLSPELTGSSTPSETSSNPSHSQSLGVSINSSLNSSNLLGSFANFNSPFNKDPRFVIWAESPSSAPRQQSPANVYPASRKRSSATVETRHYPHHPASASTSNLGIDHSTGRLTHALNPTSVAFTSPSSPSIPKRWSRSARTPTSHHSNIDSLSNSSPNLLTDVRHPHDDSGHRRSREELSQLHSTISHGEEHTPKLGNDRILMAATIERWVAELTTHIDSLGLVEFFYTYRAIIKPTELAQLLASRFEWSIMFRSLSYAKTLPDWNLHSVLVDPNLEKGILGLDGRLISVDLQGETLRRVAKVRTFVMIRHWLLHHFEDDFLTDVSLQTELHNWVENLIEKIKRVQRIISRLDNRTPSDAEESNHHHPTTPSPFSGEDDLRILKSLRKVLKELQLTHHQSFNVAVRPGSTPIDQLDDDDKQGRLNRKSTKVDVRDLFAESDKRNDQTSARRNRRSHTADLTDLQRSSPKVDIGHGRAHSINTLVQVRASNFARSDLRLCEADHNATNSPEVLQEEENPRASTEDVDLSKSDEKLILKLKQVFQFDTRRAREGVYHQIISKEIDSDPSRHSLHQANITLPKQHPHQMMISRMRPPESTSDLPKSHNAAQPRLNLSNHTPAPFNQGSLTFPQHHNPFQRYFTSTMGTFGRFKRMINNRSGPHLASNAAITSNHYTGVASGVDSFSSSLTRETGSQQDPQQNEVGDLLCAKGGLERYLNFFEIQKDSSISSYQENLTKEPIQVDCNGLSKPKEPANTDSGPESMVEVDQSSGSPVVQYDDCSESQLSLSSSLSNTTCSTQSMHSESGGEPKTEASTADLVVVSPDVSGEQHMITKSTPARDEHLLHGSMSTETIKSEAHHLALAGGGMDLLKKQLRKKFTNKDMCPVLMRASMDESFSGTVPEHSNSFTRHSEDSPRLNAFSLSVSAPNGEKDLSERPTSVQLDDIDLLDSDEDSPVGVQKLRRLPGAVDLKQAIAFGRKSLFNLKGGLLKGNDDRSKRFSTETSSSIGTRRVPSIAASMFRRSKLSHRSSIPNSTTPSLAPSAQESSLSEQNEADSGTPGVVANFVADGLESDDDEPGDVEAALRRLEGVIDADREKEKARKVELQMIKSMEASRRTRTFSHPTSDDRCSYNSQTDEADELETCSESAEDDEASEESDEDVLDAHNNEAEGEDEDERDEQQDREEQVEHEDGEEDDVNEEKAVQLQESTCSSEPTRKSMSILLERSALNSPIAEGDEEEADTQPIPAPNLSPTMPGSIEYSNPSTANFAEASLASSKPPVLTTQNHAPASKPGIRFFTAHSKGTSLDDIGLATNHSEDHVKTLRGNGKRLATRSQQVMTRKSSLHKLFSANNNPPKSSSQLKPKGIASGSIPPLPPPPYNSTTGKPAIIHSLPLPPVHRSFLLDCRTEILAQQFCLIERDLLRNITWQELLLSKWQEDRSSSHHHGYLNGGTGQRGTRKKKGVPAEDSVTCWETFMKQRAKEKMRIKGRIQSNQNFATSSSNRLMDVPAQKLDGTEINALIMRFNLTCNWVASELVLTLNLDERVALLGKFIRLAFKCYRQNNFQTLTQIIHGLQTPYVERLKKTWSKLGIWESRMFRDLKEFTSHLSNFKSLRNVQDSLINDSPSTLSSSSATQTTTSTSTQHSINSPNTSAGNLPGNVSAHFLHSSEAPASSNIRTSHNYNRSSNSNNACIPFLGLYLRDLTVNDELPTYLDPTDPSIPVEIDPKTGKLKTLSNPKVFEDLPRLPTIGEPVKSSSDEPDRPLPKQEDDDIDSTEHGYYPLVNINKLRTYAKIILKIKEFQTRSIRNYTFETDSKWFLTCLKIKCLSSEQLRLLSKTCEP